MGRLQAETQKPFAASVSQYNLTNTYNQAGDLVQNSNSFTAITLTSGVDSVNRLTSLTSSMMMNSGVSFPTTLFSVTNYGAAGINKAKYAGDPNSTGFFNLFRYYDNRLRLKNNEIYSNTDAFGSGTVTISGVETCAIHGFPAAAETTNGTSGVCAGYAQGQVSITAGLTETVNTGQGSTPPTIAQQLAASFNQSPNSTVSATVSDSGPVNSPCQGGSMPSTGTPCEVITFTSIVLGTSGDISLSASGSVFTATASGVALTGGVGTPQGDGQAYVFKLSYDHANNVAVSADPTNGQWSYHYDTLNRLTSAAYYPYEGTGVNTPAGVATLQCWSYDGFGNRLFEADELTANNPTACPSPLTIANATHRATYNTSNKVSSTDTVLSGFTYDGAGNVLKDALNLYLYDAEGRLCAVQNQVSGASTQYVYDAEGSRVAKGNLGGSAIWPVTGNGVACRAPTIANGFTLATSYLHGASGQEDVEIWNATGAWRHNVFAGGSLLATYNFSNSGSTPLSLSFAFNDWLGTKRMEVNASGQLVNSWSSDPFGNYLTPRYATSDPSEQHFTGKERDTESGNDYFGARYYASSMGRFMSPDPSQLYYADPTNPQSFNLYSYALNNPLKNTDPTGLYCDYGDGSAADNMDPSQFDYHSSQSECETADENGNKGTWINDAETHQDENGNWTDNEGRQENYSMAVNSAPAAQGAPSTGFKIPNFTVQLGVSINLGVFGPLTLTGFSGFLIDSHGHVGGYNGGGGGLSVGAGGSAGLQVSASNGNSICAMGGHSTTRAEQLELAWVVPLTPSSVKGTPQEELLWGAVERSASQAEQTHLGCTQARTYIHSEVTSV
jgi:RHS repeat-associated protein